MELTRQQLRDEVAELLRVQPTEVADDDNLMDYGLDSIRLMQLAQRWHDRGLMVPFAALAERPQLSHWWDLIRQALERTRP